MSMLEAESRETRCKGGLHAFGTMIGVPQFGGHENVFACDFATGESCLQGVADLALVAVAFRTIEVPESGFECVAGGRDG